MFVSNTTVTKTYTTSDGTQCATLYDAKAHEIGKLINENPQSPNVLAILENADQIITILKTKRGRSAASAKKTKKTSKKKGGGKPEQAAVTTPA